MNIKRILTLLLAAALVFGLIGCTPKEDTPSGGTSASGDNAASGGEKKIIYAIADDPEEMNPTLNSYSRSSNVLQQLFRGLYKFDVNKQLVPALAESHTVDDTGTVYTFKLRKDLKWSDGSPLTANDFEYAWKLALTPETASKSVNFFFYLKNGKEYYEGTATIDDVGVKALDDLTLEVTLNTPTPWLIALTATTYYMPVCKAINEQYGLDWAKTAEHYVSSGAYMLKSMNSKEKISMVKNPYYYAADEVKIDAIDFMIIPDQETQYIAFENGELTINGDPTPQMITPYKGTAQYNEAIRAGARHLDVNTADPIHPEFQDARVRQALAISIDRKALMDSIIRSNEKPIYGFTPYGIASVTDPTKDFREIVGDVYKEDVAEAQRLLAEAGFPNGEGFPKFRLITQTTQLQKDIAQALQSMWSDNLNIECEIKSYEKDYWDELENDESFDVGFCGWTDDYLDPHAHLAIYGIGGNEFEPNWNQPLADGSYQESVVRYSELVEQMVVVTDPVEREKIFIEAEHILAEVMPTIPLYSYTDFFISKPNLHGVSKNALGHINFEYAYFD
ncbi:MAG: peptide ABC transporter substrate-binding protein [Oscillospiraceae bacterium]|jgi:oligopeptide transport system substrate-binding protein|nr:peptide ABC transporter substrate-binding protein [Oscillospiraceae bacterium]